MVDSIVFVEEHLRCIIKYVEAVDDELDKMLDNSIIKEVHESTY